MNAAEVGEAISTTMHQLDRTVLVKYSCGHSWHLSEAEVYLAHRRTSALWRFMGCPICLHTWGTGPNGTSSRLDV